MDKRRFPTIDEFWRRLERREVEPDLREALADRAAALSASLPRLQNGATVVAVVERILPGSAVPASVLAAFIDAQYDRQLGRGDERDGVLPRALLIPRGFEALDEAVGGSFAAQTAPVQDGWLERAERGELEGGPGFDSKEWFDRVRELVLLGFGSDPRGMVQMGYPGPSYKTGHVWLEQDEIAARAARRPGYMEL